MVKFKNTISKIKIFIELSRNDFKNRFAGSQLGVFWAFVQPVVNVTIYWFIFEKGLKSQPLDNFPYLLWLIAGICPWFFFNEALNNSSGSLIEYSYIVKKIKFPIELIPAIKVLSAFYVHLFFVLLVNVIFIVYGIGITVYALQVFYYSLCVLILSISISYFTSAITVFFRDMTQIVSIILQYAMWFAPIMIDEKVFPYAAQKLMKINPMYYVINGYRDSLINKVWFWEHLASTCYFWMITLIFFIIGKMVFTKMKSHFADIL